MSPLISVIVPVYNVEQYIEKCIDSLINQTYKNLEIILVDDGSTDFSAEICDIFSKKDVRIKVVHKFNEGAGKARNVALEMAQGDFITFVDSDDYLSYNTYEIIMKIFDEDSSIDIVEYEYLICYDDNVEFKIYGNCNKKAFLTTDALQEHINNHYFQQVIWNKVYRKNVIEEVFFPENTSIDDEYWTYLVLGNSKKLIHIDLKLYAYRQQQNSISHTLGFNARTEGIKAKLIRHKYVKEKFPELETLSSFSIWLDCVYESQIVKRCYSKSEYKQIRVFCDEVLYKSRVKSYKCLNLKFKMKLWFILSRISWTLCINIRNFLKVGL